MTFTSGGLGLNVHIELKRLRVLFRAIGKSTLLVLDLTASNIRVITLNIKVTGLSETKFLSVPSTNMKVQIAILMLLLANAGLKELVGCWRSTGLEMLKHRLPVQGTLGVSQEDRLSLVLK